MQPAGQLWGARWRTIDTDSGVVLVGCSSGAGVLAGWKCSCPRADAVQLDYWQCFLGTSLVVPCIYTSQEGAGADVWICVSRTVLLRLLLQLLLADRMCPSRSMRNAVNPFGHSRCLGRHYSHRWYHAKLA